MSRVGRDHSRAAFEQFVAEATDGLLRTAYLVTGDAAHAEDLVQESLFEVARRWSRVVSMEQPKAYARRILINRALDDSERRSRHRAELEEPRPAHGRSRCESDTAREFTTAVDQRLELIRALAELAPRQRAVLVLRYFDDLSESEVASTLGCTVGTVKSTTARALDEMRDLVPTEATRSEVRACAEREGPR